MKTIFSVEDQAEEIGKVYQMESKPIKKVPKTSVKEIMQKRNVSATGNKYINLLNIHSNK